MTDAHARARSLAEEAVVRELTADEVVELDTHLGACSACRDAVRPLRVAHIALQEWGAMEPAASSKWTPVTAAPQRRTFRLRHAIAAMLAFGIGIAGFAAGRLTAAGDRAPAALATQPDIGGLYALFLEEPEVMWPRATDQAAYASWANLLRSNDQFAGGMRLEEDEGLYVPQQGPAVAAHAAPLREVNFSGLFLVRASSYSDAVAMARLGPHGSSGGVLVRRVALVVDD